MLNALKRAVPPRVRDACKRVLGLPVYGDQKTGEKGAEFYDRAFEHDESWKRHYTASSYYFIWTLLLDRLRRAGSSSVLEIGCGSGQLAAAIRDAGLVQRYVGFDFSELRLAQARVSCPEFEFHVADAFETDLFTSSDYDTAIATEFLEHVERDIEILQRLRRGTRFIGTVPNFPWLSHVRHFASEGEVTQRYQTLFEDFSVVKLLANDKGKTFFVIEGVTRT